MKRFELLICGFGGQGVIFAGVLLGHATVKAGLEAAQSAAYGSEARGSACHAGVIISDGNISYPKVRQPDLLIAMSQAGYDKFVSSVKDCGTILYESDLVNPEDLENVKQIPVKATAIATDIGKKGVANVVMTAAAIGQSEVIDREFLKTALDEHSPEAFREANMKALEAGFELVSSNG